MNAGATRPVAGPVRIADVREAAQHHGEAVLILIVSARGSTPRDAGAALLVTPDQTVGTIGGGAAEHAALAEARRILADPTLGPQTLDMPLGPDLDQCCGGHLRVAVAPVRPAQITQDRVTLWPGGPVFHDPAPDRPVFVYGAGHVGRALVFALAPLPFEVTWVDARPGLMVDATACVDTIETPLPEQVAAQAPNAAMHVILTHSHALDLEIAAAVLARQSAFCGLIGSASKRAQFRRRLKARGVPVDHLTCPIGLPDLPDKRPAVIAASVAAQLLHVDAAKAARLDRTG